MASKKSLIFGVFLGHTETQMKQAVKIHTELLMQQERVILLSPIRPLKVDVVILPDTGGINTNHVSFFNHYTVVPPYPGQDQWFQQFLDTTFDWYWKEMKIPVVGIGTGALCVYSHMLSGKLQLKDGEMIPIPKHDAALFDYPGDHPDWTFRTSQCIGYPAMPEFEDMYVDIVKSFFSSPKNGGDLMPVEVPVPQNPPTFHNTAHLEMPLPPPPAS